MVFWTKFKLFEYLVIPVDFTNALASFQLHIYLVLRSFSDSFVIVYLDNILVCLRNLFQKKKYTEEIF